MPVGIDKAVRIHESQVFRLVVGRASSGEGLRDEIVNFLTALATEAEQGFRFLAGIADGLGSELAKFGVRAQHDVDCVDCCAAWRIWDAARGRSFCFWVNFPNRESIALSIFTDREVSHTRNGGLGFADSAA